MEAIEMKGKTCIMLAPFQSITWLSEVSNAHYNGAQQLVCTPAKFVSCVLGSTD